MSDFHGDDRMTAALPPLGSTVALFVTCVIDQIRPGIGRASLALLESAGYKVALPTGQACCGQPAYSAGHPEDARRLAMATVDCLAGDAHVVVPSGSCAAMIRTVYPRLLKSTLHHAAAADLASRTWELTELLARRPPEFIDGDRSQVAIHDSCHGLRLLGLGPEARTLLRQAGYEICELSDPGSCCGFGGIFAAMQPEISIAIADDKLAMAEDAAPILSGTDSACLLHLEGRRRAVGGGPSEIRHVAELLANRLAGGVTR